MPTPLSKRNIIRFTSPETKFHLPFPVSVDSLRDHDAALGERFKAIGGISKSVQYIISHSQRSVKKPDLGILNERFEASGSLGKYKINVTPIGGNDKVLLGSFDLQDMDTRERALEAEDIVDLFGAAARVGRTATGYLVLNRATLAASGMGVMSYSGIAGIFGDTPSSENLFSFVKEFVPINEGFPMARTDISTREEF